MVLHHQSFYNSQYHLILTPCCKLQIERGHDLHERKRRFKDEQEHIDRDRHVHEEKQQWIREEAARIARAKEEAAHMQKDRDDVKGRDKMRYQREEKDKRLEEEQRAKQEQQERDKEKKKGREGIGGSERGCICISKLKKNCTAFVFAILHDFPTNAEIIINCVNKSRVTFLALVILIVTE